MANTPISFIRSKPGPSKPDVLVTTVTERRPASRETSLFTALPKEPEDARITGGTRSLDRRLLALNLTWRHGGSNAA